MTTDGVASNYRNVFSHSSGGQKSETKVSAGLVSPGGSGGESPGLFPRFWRPPESFGVPRIVDMSLQALPASSHGLLVSGVRAHPGPGLAHLESLILWFFLNCLFYIGV